MVRRAAPVLLLLGMVGCDSILSIEQVPRRVPGVAYASTACDRCANDTCADASFACESDRACRPLLQCITLCAADAPGCRAACETKFPLALEEEPYRAIDRCFRKSCTQECYGVAGLARTFGEKCECLDKACAAQELACIRSGLDDGSPRLGDCERSFACAAASAIHPETLLRCAAEFPAGRNETNAVKECWASTTCEGCPIAGVGHYECAGNFTYRPPTQPKVTITFRLTTFDSAQKPIVGAAVRACSPEKCERCDLADPVVEKPTAADGTVSLELPTGITGFAGCFDFKAPGFVHQSVALGRPLLHDGETVMFMVASDTLPALGFLAGTTLAPDRGQVIVFAVDCFLSLSSGVSMDLEPFDFSDPLVRRGFFVGSGLDTKATETGRLGVGVFLNAKPGFAVVRTSQKGKLVGATPFVVREGMVNAVLSMPRTKD